MTVKIKWADFQQSIRSRSLPRPVESQDDLRGAARALIDSVFPPAKRVRLVGVTLSNFAAAPAVTPAEFALTG